MEISLSYRSNELVQILFKLIHPLMAAVMESPLRQRFNNPFKILKAAGIQSGQKVLEVGCGTGFFTIPASKLVGEKGCLYAIDVYPPAIKLVEEKVQNAYIDNVELTNTDALDSGLPSNSFDIILLFGVIPAPVLPLDRLLPEMHRLLKPEGTMAVWTAFPFWSPKSVARSGIFIYINMENGVYNFQKVLV
jgi:demethylmenaquinone methyltransferase/2-methoxy-6-polyprenyl-1,4-benzoquinol methylase